MRKIHTALLAGAVLVGLSALGSLAAFVPSLAASKPVTHKLTLQLPGGGSETITYTGNAVPKVAFHARQTAALWPAPFAVNWMAPSLIALDPFVSGMDRQFNLFASLPLLMPSLPDQPLSAAALSNLPAGTSYSMVSETTGNGVCTRFTQITKAAGDAKPKIVSQSSGNCGADTGRAAKAINLRSTSGRVTTQNM